MDFHIIEGYDGKGKCRQIMISGDTCTNYGTLALDWAKRVGWYGHTDEKNNVICSALSKERTETLEIIKREWCASYPHFPMKDEVVSFLLNVNALPTTSQY